MLALRTVLVPIDYGCSGQSGQKEDGAAHDDERKNPKIAPNMKPEHEASGSYLADALQSDVDIGSNSKNARPKKRAGRRAINPSDKGTEKYRKRRHRFGKRGGRRTGARSKSQDSPATTRAKDGQF